MRLLLAVALATCGLAFVPSTVGPARAVPGECPPICDAIPDSAWIDPAAIPLYPVYHWPGLAGLSVTAPSPRFGFEAMCAIPPIANDASCLRRRGAIRRAAPGGPVEPAGAGRALAR